MKSLVVFYSRTGNTAKIAREIADGLNCDIEEIIDTKDRSGVLNYLTSSRDAMGKALTVLEDPTNDPAGYDLVIIGTPKWANHVSTPVRTYLNQNQEKFKELAFFCTVGGDDFTGPINDMIELSRKSPVATLGVRGKDFKNGTYHSRVEEFIKAIKKE